MMGFGHGSYTNGFYMIVGFLFLPLLAVGVMMIASSMNSSIAQRTSFFSVLRCVGADRKQVMRVVRLEALNLCKSVIPIGIALGIVVTWALCAMLKFLTIDYFADIPLFGVSPVGIIMGVVIGLLTFFAARPPARRASKELPLTAVSGNAMLMSNLGKTAGMGFLKVESSLGINHVA